MSQWTEYEDLVDSLHAETAKFKVITMVDLRTFAITHFNVNWEPKTKESCIALFDITGKHAMGFMEIKNLLLARKKVYPSQIVEYIVSKGYLKQDNFLLLNYTQ